jgi:hypothetical protein
MKALKIALALAMTVAMPIVAPAPASAAAASNQGIWLCFYEFSFEADGYIYDVYTCYPLNYA